MVKISGIEPPETCGWFVSLTEATCIISSCSLITRTLFTYRFDSKFAPTYTMALSLLRTRSNRFEDNCGFRSPAVTAA